MSKVRWRMAAGIVATAGALSWLLKLGVIVATGGDVIDTGAAAVFYLLGLGLLVLGGALSGLWLTMGRNLFVRLAGVVLGIIGFVLSFVVLDSAGGAIAGERGPDYASSELGVLLAAILWLAIGLWLWLGGMRLPARETAGTIS